LTSNSLRPFSDYNLAVRDFQNHLDLGLFWHMTFFRDVTQQQAELCGMTLWQED
jgi:hypothetical protein